MVKPREKYRHFKGNTYLILQLAKDSESCEDLVVYQNVDNGSTWVRPLIMFDDYVKHEGKTIKRYELIDSK
jgi:hypothetical protein